MKEFLGEVRPLEGRWNWPFSRMEEGDWFIVSKLLRDPEKLRHMVAVRGNQLMKRFRVERNPVDYPGFTKVTCGAREEGQLIVEYGTAKEHILAGYGVQLDHVPVWAFREGRDVPVVVEIDRAALDAPERIVFMMIDVPVEMKREGDKLVFERYAGREEKLEEVMA